MAAVFLAPLYILINVYLVRWLLLWAGACGRSFQSFWTRALLTGVYVFFATSLLSGFLIRKPARLHTFLQKTGNYFLGVLAYMILVTVPADLIRIVLKYGFHAKITESRAVFAAAGAFCVLCILGVSLSGVLCARRIRVTPYEVRLGKSAGGLSSLRIVLLADTHFGVNQGVRHAERLAALVNAQHPDLICIAGDVFDNDYNAIDDPEGVQNALKSFRSRYGTYACWGNHDLNEPILAGFTFRTRESKAAEYASPQMRKLLKEANVTILEDRAALIDGRFYLVGRKDAARAAKTELASSEAAGSTSAGFSPQISSAHQSHPARRAFALQEIRTEFPVKQKRLAPARLTEKLDRRKPIIFLDHEPDELPETANAGADLDLCGHTHDGQIFPANLLLKLLWKNSCGCRQKNGFCSIVTSGAGVWGPAMRVGTNSEICLITVKFAPEKR